MTDSPVEDPRRPTFVAYHESGDHTLRDALVAEHLPLARRLAHRFTNRGIPFEDLFQVASVGLVQAVDRFDPYQGTAFTTFATPTILGEIKRHFRDRAWDVRVPRRLQELHVELNGIISTLSQRLGRSPTISEMAIAARASEEEVIEAIEAGRAYHSASLEAPSDSGMSSQIEQALIVEDTGLINSDNRLDVEALLDELPGREALILRLRYWGRMSQSDIADRLGISQMHVSRLIAHSHEKIVASMNHRGLEP